MSMRPRRIRGYQVTEEEKKKKKAIARSTLANLTLIPKRLKLQLPMPSLRKRCMAHARREARADMNVITHRRHHHHRKEKAPRET